MSTTQFSPDAIERLRQHKPFISNLASFLAAAVEIEERQKAQKNSQKSSDNSLEPAPQAA
jgi:hypothetical protein